MWLAGTRQVLCAVVAIEGNRGRSARPWPQARGPGRVALSPVPGKRDYTVQAPLRSRSGDNRFPELRQASP